MQRLYDDDADFSAADLAALSEYDAPIPVAAPEGSSSDQRAQATIGARETALCILIQT